MTNFNGIECPPLNNSYIYAFGVEFLFTVADLALPRISDAGESTLFGVIFAIALHGLLHLFLGLTECKLVGDGIIGIIGPIVFGLFISLFWRASHKLVA